ncbi:MAG: phosphate-starvation-inducible PsiE family protein [Sphaerobacter sp.]|nr:phosphate-starvation-inducible PsiE family protein [Sphaerobacter sp.]
MSDEGTVSEMTTELDVRSPEVHTAAVSFTGPAGRRFLRVSQFAQGLVYSATAFLFLAAAVVMLGYSVLAFVDAVTVTRTEFPVTMVTLINDLLLVLIIMEVLATVLSYLREQAFSLLPFLFVAAISATRRILAVGAAMSVERLEPEVFRQSVIDLGVNAGLILVLTLALFLLSRTRVASHDGVAAETNPPTSGE